MMTVTTFQEINPTFLMTVDNVYRSALAYADNPLTASASKEQYIDCTSDTFTPDGYKAGLLHELRQLQASAPEAPPMEAQEFLDWLDRD